MCPACPGRTHDLPPWIASNQRDNKLMALWLNERLDEVQKGLLDNLSVDFDNLFDHGNLSVDDDPQFAFFWEEIQARRKAGGKEIYEAQQGNIEPLRKLYPHIAEFIHLPKRPGKGTHFQKSQYNVERPIFADLKKRALTFAAWDVATIRDLWERWYPKKKRSNPSALSAEDFAAMRHRVDVNKLCEWMRSRQLPEDRHRENKRNYIFSLI